MNKKYLLPVLSLAIIALVATASLSSVAASTINKNIDGKGAVAQFDIPGAGGSHIINAVLSMTNSGKDAELYISIVHPIKGTSASVASGPVNIKWSMNHVIAEGNLTFTGPRSGTHIITIVWSTEGSASNGHLSENTGKGLMAEVHGTWKVGAAELFINDATGKHQNSYYTSSWAIVVHGSADITLN